MEKVKALYETPEVEIVNIETEMCFATSPVTPGSEPLTPGQGVW